MRPRILYDLSRKLAVTLEEALRGGAVARIPVFLCHPLDPLESRTELEGSAAGILYPVRVTPDLRYRRAGLQWEEATVRQPQDRFRWDSLWVRVRYVFLVAGGSLELELEALAAALRALHDHPAVTLDRDALGLDLHDADDAESGSIADGTFPLTIVEAPEGWRELGLPDHRLVVAFEVSVPIRSQRTEPVERVLERELELQRLQGLQGLQELQELQELQRGTS